MKLTLYLICPSKVNLCFFIHNVVVTILQGGEVLAMDGFQLSPDPLTLTLVTGRQLLRLVVLLLPYLSSCRNSTSMEISRRINVFRNFEHNITAPVPACHRIHLS